MKTELFYEQRKASIELRIDAALFNKALLLCREADSIIDVDFADSSLTDEEVERRLRRFDLLQREIKEIIADIYCGETEDDDAPEFADIADIADDDGDGFIGSIDSREFLDEVEESAEFEDKISFALECIAEQIREYGRFRDRVKFPPAPADEDKYSSYLSRFETVDKVQDFVVSRGRREETIFGEDYFKRYERLLVDFVVVEDEVDSDGDAPAALPDFISERMWRAMCHAHMRAIPKQSRDGRDHVPYLLNFVNVSVPAAETLMKEYINRQTKKVFLAIDGEEDENIAAALASAAAERYERFVIRKHERITRRRVFIPKY